MNLLKKIIILTNLKNQTCGYLTITNNDDVLNLNIKAPDLEKNHEYTLTLLAENKTEFEKNISGEKLKDYSFNLSTKIDISKNIDAVITETSSEECIVFGNTSGKRPNINLAMQPRKQELKEEKPRLTDESPEEKTFFLSVKEKVEQMFENYPTYPELSNQIENSKWVKVEFDESGLYYLLGLIYANENVKYICYAIPSNKNTPPPSHMAEFCSFVQCDEKENGFYVMSQDATNGESILI